MGQRDPLPGEPLSGEPLSGEPLAATGDTLEERVRELEEQLRQVREQRGQHGRRPRTLLHTILPPETRRHLRAAQRERLLAVRSLVDAAIKRTEQEPKPERAERPRRPESVRIE